MKKIIYILTCVLVTALLVGCDIGILDGPGMENKYPDENLIGEYVKCERIETDFGIIEIPQFCNLMPQSDSTKEAK